MMKPDSEIMKMSNFEAPPALEKGQDINRHQCKICNRKFVNKVGLDTHTRHVHYVHDEDKKWKIQIGHFKVDLKDFHVVQDGKKFISCFKINCEALLKTSEKIKEHIEKDHNGKPYTCEKCLADFRLKDDLYKHAKSAHGVNLKKNQKCFICDHVTTGPKLLELHIAKAHEGKKPFSCDKCDKGFSRAFRLKEHVQSVHEGEKHLCDTCGKGYIHKNALKEHINVIHNNFKQKTEQYLCNICGKDYTKKWVLEQHMASIHNEGILDKKYKCDHCVYASVMR